MFFVFDAVYVIALVLVSPVVLVRRWRYGRYRRGMAAKLLGLSRRDAERLVGDPARDVVWFHAVSVGEVQLLPELVRRWRSEHPETTVVVSSSTDTGYDLACRHFGEATVFFCPLDFSWAVKRTIRNLRCKHLILMELELWPNLIAAMTRVGGTVAVVNARLSATSAARYQKFRWALRPTFARLAMVGCQSEIAAERFVACGAAAERVVVTGSLKFDNAPHSRDTTDVLQRWNWAGASDWHRIWCVGSTQSGEEAMILRVYARLSSEFPELRLILVPRHVERFDMVATSIAEAGLTTIRRSEAGRRRNATWIADEVILVDTIGELRAWWGVGTIATVGGSFGDRGGQNMLEPAGYGNAVSFGPNTKNFNEIAEALIRAGGAIRVADEADLERFVRTCLDRPDWADALGIAARAVVEGHRGAYSLTLASLPLPLGDLFNSVARRIEPTSDRRAA